MTITRDDALKADPGLKRVSRLRARACPRLLGGGSLLKSTAGSPFTAASFVRRPALARVTRPRGDVLVAPLAGPGLAVATATIVPVRCSTLSGQSSTIVEVQ